MESLHGCLESSLKSTEACNSGGGEDKAARKREWNLLGHASLSPSVWGSRDGPRWEEMTISSCSKNWEWVEIKSL